MSLLGLLLLPHAISTTYTLTKKGQQENILDTNKLEIFCHPGRLPSPLLFWASTSLKISLHTSDFKSYIGPNRTDIEQQVEEQSLLNSFSEIMLLRSSNLKVPPFSPSCSGVLAQKPYSVILELRTLNYYQMLATVLGLVVFSLAPSLCRSTVVHYTAGISIGISLSLFLLAYILQRKLNGVLGLWAVIGSYLVSLYGVIIVVIITEVSTKNYLGKLA